MNDILRIDAPFANFRATASNLQAPLARLPAGHAVTTTGDPHQAGWQPCRTSIGGHLLDGFVHRSLLRSPISPEVDALVEAAGAEYKDFQFGTRHETHPDSKTRIKAYWLSFASTAQPVSEPWSAAFISFIVKKAAIAKSFEFSGRHTDYLSDSKRAFLAGDATRAYWAVRLDQQPLRVGDMVAAYRTGGVCGTKVRSYDSLPGDFCSHCDVVVAVREGKASTLGGNVSNTVKLTEVALTADGRASDGKQRIAVMARTF